MRIRKRQVPLPLSSLSPTPLSLSDPHLINRSWGVVQFNQTSILHPTTASSVAAIATSVAASISASPSTSPKPSSYSCPTQNLSSLGMEDSVLGGGDRKPSDHHQTQQTFEKATNGPDSSCPSWPHKQEGNQNQNLCLELSAMEEEKQHEKDKSNDSREIATTGSETAPGKALPLSTPLQGSVQGVEGRWCEGEEVFPLKKRKGSFDAKVKEETAMDQSNKKMKMKTKMNNKCSVFQNDIGNAVEGGSEQKGGEEKESVAGKVGVNVNRKRVRGTTLLEGSRCSRVNGRGWRCCQQTLVGYSLCEHHLGKGRLRSITSFRSRSSLGSTATTTGAGTASPARRKKSKADQTSSSATVVSSGPSSSSPERKQAPSGTCSHDYDGVEHEDDCGEDEMKKMKMKIKPAVMKRKKTMKLGMVKARSINSLLGQSQTNSENVGMTR